MHEKNANRKRTKNNESIERTAPIPPRLKSRVSLGHLYEKIE